MFDEKLYRKTFSNIHAPEETLSEVLKMTVMKNKRSGVIRFTRILVAAAVIVAMLATTAFAYVGFTQYENPMQMLKTFFGGEAYHLDEGGYMGTGTYYDLHWDVIYPTVEQIPMDEQLAEQQVAPYIAGVGNSVTDEGDTLTVQAHLHDPTTESGIIYITLENPNGVGSYNLQWNGEVWWSGVERVVANNCWGKNFIIADETTDTKLSIAHYYSGLYGDEDYIQVGFGNSDKWIDLPLDNGGSMSAITLANGDICVSAVGIQLRVDNMDFLSKTDTDGTQLLPNVDRIKYLSIRYHDGNEYVIHADRDGIYTQNYKYSIGSEEGTQRTYSFNRLIDVTKIEAVTINDVEFADIDTIPQDSGSQNTELNNQSIAATAPAVP